MSTAIVNDIRMDVKSALPDQIVQTTGAAGDHTDAQPSHCAVSISECADSIVICESGNSGISVASAGIAASAVATIDTHEAVVFETMQDAQKEIDDNLAGRYQDAIDGIFEFDCVETDEYIDEVELLANGYLRDSRGNRYKAIRDKPEISVKG